MNRIEEAKSLLREEKKEAAICLLREELEKHPDAETEEHILYELGVIYNGMADFRQALNCFNAVLRLNENHSQARTHVAMINDILDFYNKDLLNP